MAASNAILQQICDAIDIIINKRVANLQFDKTVRATIVSVEDLSIGKYKVKYQDSVFFAYSDPDKTYKKGALVYVLIPSNDYNKPKLIIGSVKKIGTEYLTAVSAKDRVTEIGKNILTTNKNVNFCSYKTTTNELLGDEIRLDTKDLAAYKKEASYFLIGMTVRTNLPTEQQVGGGNYGIIVTTQEYNTGYKNHTVQSDQDKIIRTYVLDVNNMLGQPYKFYLAEKQYALFAIDGKNLEKITKITAFCKGFPQQRNGLPDDIFLSDFSITFADILPEEELNSSSLRILTPNGSYYRSQNDDGIFLEALVKIKGRKVNYNLQKIDFYWFVKDTRITSSEKYYSPYAGDGWKCLNQLLDAANHWFAPLGYRKNIPITLSPSAETTFKCVGVYEDITLSSTIKLTNDYSSNTVTITSSAGTQFHFDTGRTTLTCNVTSKSDPLSSLTYYWAYRTSENPFQTISTRTKSLNNIPIATSTNYITYECSVYNNSGIIGTALITLVNGIPENEYTLIIKNGSQIFKYDEYGVSPVSRSAEPKDRITINNLSFEIYDDQGNLATPIDDVEKIKRCLVKWIWPDTLNTLLLNQPSYNGELKTLTIYNRITNVPHTRTILPNIANLYFTIKNNYDLDLLDNQIQLLVNFEGHNLVASTNFTFVKEGQSGTNGTKYIARIVPKNNKYEKIYVEGNKLIGMYKTITKLYKTNQDAYITTEQYIFEEVASNPLKSLLWDGSDTALYDSSRQNGNIQGTLTWELVDVGVKRNNHNISINKNNGVITVAETFQNNSASIIKTTFSSSHLSELARKYYATYPIIIVNKKSATNTYHPIVVGGFDQCMYQSDGTRGAFKTKPFTFKLFDGDNKEKVVVENSVIWTPSWTGQSITGNNVTIEPPSYYNSESVNNYIKVTYANNAYTIILPVYLYLNQYGMAAMNDWDGTSIKINNTGDQYILAPQIGAGTKDNTNTFTGITMGKSFNANNSNKIEVGLMGFTQGKRSIFLDANSGKATFGVAGESQIVISPEPYGIAPKGSLYSGNYYKDYSDDGQGAPKELWSKKDIEQSRENRGMLIDLATPKIRFGNGNFEVNKDGEITARGGGNIAGWKIDDENIYSENKHIYLNSNPSTVTSRASYNGSTVNGPRIYGQNDANRKHDTLVSTSSGFYLGSDGLSIGSKFLATNQGIVLIGTGATTSVANGDNTKCWTINGNADRSYISFKRNTAVPLLYDEDEKTWNNSFSGKKGSVYLGTDGIRLGEKFAVDNNGNTILQNLYARNSGNIAGWQINKDELKSHKGNIILNTNGQIIVGKDKDIVIDEDGFITVGDDDLVKINGDGTITIKGTGKIHSNNWQIDGNGYAKFTNVDITSDHNSTLNWGDNFSVTTDGQINAIAGKIGNWELSANGFSGIGGNFSVNTNSGIKFGNGFNIGANGNGTIGGCVLSDGQLYANGLRLQGSAVGWSSINGIFCNLALSADKRSYTNVLTGGTSVTLSGDLISGYTASLNKLTTTILAITDIYWAYTERTINVLGNVGDAIHGKGKIPTVTPD